MSEQIKHDMTPKTPETAPEEPKTDVVTAVGKITLEATGATPHSSTDVLGGGVVTRKGTEPRTGAIAQEITATKLDGETVTSVVISAQPDGDPWDNTLSPASTRKKKV